MVEVNFYEQVSDELLKFAVIISKTDGKWVFCKHKERDTYEVPGGHREIGENVLETAKRELKEETGAIDFFNFTMQFPFKRNYIRNKQHSKCFLVNHLIYSCFSFN